MNTNNLTINGKLKLINNAKIINGKDLLNGTANSTVNDENGTKIVRPNVIVPSKSYNKLSNINIILNKFNKETEQIDNYEKLLNWQTYEIPFEIETYGACYGNGIFVAAPCTIVSGFPFYVYYSTDGINWKKSNTLSIDDSPRLYFRSICYGNGKFVTINANKDSNSLILYSTDGINWQKSSSTMLGKRYWRGISYGNGKFIAIAQNSSYAAYSTDGITWKECSMPSSYNWLDSCYGNGKFVAVGESSGIAYSTDGITWKSASVKPSANWGSVCYGNGRFIITSIESSSKAAKTAYSTDGNTWYLAGELPIDEIIEDSGNIYHGDNKYYCSAYGNNKFIALNQGYSTAQGIYPGSSISAFSEDGTTWHNSANLPRKCWGDLVYGNGKFVAFIGNGKGDNNFVAVLND